MSGQVLDVAPDLSGGCIRLGRDSGIPLGIVGGRRAADRGGRAAVASGRGAPDGESDLGYSSGGEGEEGGGFIPAARRKCESAEERRARKGDVKEAQVGTAGLRRRVGRRGEGGPCFENFFALA